MSLQLLSLTVSLSVWDLRLYIHRHISNHVWLLRSSLGCTYSWCWNLQLMTNSKGAAGGQRRAAADRFSSFEPFLEFLFSSRIMRDVNFELQTTQAPQEGRGGLSELWSRHHTASVSDSLCLSTDWLSRGPDFIPAFVLSGRPEGTKSVCDSVSQKNISGRTLTWDRFEFCFYVKWSLWR